MSAYLDKSQGITFVYSNIYEAYKKAKDAKIDSPFSVETSRVIKNSTAKAEEYKPKEFRNVAEPLAVPEGFKEQDEKEKKSTARPIANLQKNLSELSSAHDRLRFLLQELDALTKKK